jgi:hypothetical protein
MPRQMKKGGVAMMTMPQLKKGGVPMMMPVPARGWGDFVSDLKNFDFNRAKKWFGLKKGGKVAKPRKTKK